VSLRDQYDLIRPAAGLDEARAQEIVRAARPYALALLRGDARTALQGDGPTGPPVSARLVAPADARGGSLIPAWPLRGEDGRVTIEFVRDWGTMLAGWCATLGESGGASTGLVRLVESGDRQWVGIANDVLQLYVPDPPSGTYSMVRHHALMLVAATLWLGRERANLWLEAHSAVARTYLGRVGGGGLWPAVESAERSLASLLADPRARQPADETVSWLETDREAAEAYREYLGAASLGLAALLETAPVTDDPAPWLQACIYDEHPDPDFNRDRIEAFARQSRTP
jgi:hypothetical protein